MAKKKRKRKPITATPQFRYYTVNGKRKKFKVWKENGKVKRRVANKKKRKSSRVGKQSGHGSLQKDGYYARSDRSRPAKYSRARDVKYHAKHRAAPGRPFEGDTRKVYYKETKNGNVTGISSKKDGLKGKKGKMKVGWI